MGDEEKIKSESQPSKTADIGSFYPHIRTAPFALDFYSSLLHFTLT